MTKFKYIFLIIILIVSINSHGSIPSFLKKVGNSYQEKKVIIVTEKHNNKYIVVAAYFPDNKCVQYPGSSILALPHEFVVEPDHNWLPCTEPIPH